MWASKLVKVNLPLLVLVLVLELSYNTSRSHDVKPNCQVEATCSLSEDNDEGLSVGPTVPLPGKAAVITGVCMSCVQMSCPDMLDASHTCLHCSLDI